MKIEKTAILRARIYVGVPNSKYGTQSGGFLYLLLGTPTQIFVKIIPRKNKKAFRSSQCLSVYYRWKSNDVSVMTTRPLACFVCLGG